MTVIAAPARVRRHLRQACVELQRRLRDGQPCGVEECFAARPELAEFPDVALELIYSEFVVREQLGQRPSQGECCARFPRWHEDLRQLFEVHRFTRANLVRTQSDVCLPIDAPAEVAVGRRLGAYELLEVIGRGGMGVVYRARQAGSGRVVALKMSLAGDDDEPLARARFRAEADAMARLRHPTIVRIHEVGEAGGRPYFCMELVEGGSLEDRLQGKPWPPCQAAGLIEALARAMQHAHERGVVHRDLKPGNVLLSAGERRGVSPPVGRSHRRADAAPLACGAPKIIDFGLAKLSGTSAPTRSGVILGTPGYMAPEQARGKAHHASPATDVYALGAMLYELLTGRPPFRGGNALDALRRTIMEEPVPPRRLHSSIAPDLEIICLKCLKKNPKNRYGSARKLAEDLDRFL